MATLSDRMEDYCFFDFETRAKPGSGNYGDVTAAGTHKYAKHARPIILTYAIGMGPVRCEAVSEIETDDAGEFTDSVMFTEELYKFWQRANGGEAWFVAWHTAFDRNIWNNYYDWHPLRPEMAIDAMAQAMASNLPGDLESASTVLGGPGKQKDGKKLIQLFSTENGGTPMSHPEEWARFKSYAVRDTEVLRDVFMATRQLERREWEEYWASERINERGVAVDVPFCEKAAGLAQASVGWANREIYRLTGKPTMKVSTVQQIAAWTHDNLRDPLARAILEQEIDDEDDEDNAEQTVSDVKLRLTRPHIVRLRQHLAVAGMKGPMDEVIDKVLELREYGGAASVAKFAKMSMQADEGRLKGSYIFNGAMQTGRFSSRGIQVHNMTRDHLGELEETAIADIMDMAGSPGYDRYVEEFAKAYGSAGKALSRLIRPALVAPKGKMLVWGDWSAIEARVNPWLSLTRSGDQLLDVFRRSDDDPSLPDVYMHSAGDLLHKDPHDVTKAERQSHGKIPVLSLGFGGAEGALQRMAVAYGMPMADEDATWMVAKWREANPWARLFWNALWEAVQNAVESPGNIFKAGRVSYLYHPGYLGGSLFCALPCGRLLTYPKCHWEERKVEDKKTGEKSWKWQLTYGKGHGRAALWYGKACENVTQAGAGSLLRAKLVQLEAGRQLPVVLHTHDDICAEVDEDKAEAAAALLSTVMATPEPWCESLPLAVSTTSHWWFTKALD